jgi:putative DNA primase/helicase
MSAAGVKFPMAGPCPMCGSDEGDAGLTGKDDATVMCQTCYDRIVARTHGWPPQRAQDERPRRGHREHGEASAVRWFWRGWIPLGMLTLLAGLPGLGKTTLALLLAAQTTRGELEGHLSGQPVTVLVASLEDSIESTLLPRLMAANADLGRVHFVACKAKGAALDLTRHMAEIDHMAEQHRARLLFVDPLVGTMPAGKVSSHRDQDVRSVLAPLTAISEERNLAVLAAMHFSKSAVDALLGVGGSIGFVGAARSLLIFGADPNDERGEEGPARVLAHGKCNVGRRQHSRACHIVTTTIDTDDRATIETSAAILGDEVDVSADDLVQIGRPPNERAVAEKFLRRLLSDGPHRAREVYDLAGDAGIAKRTLDRAKKDLGVDSFRRDKVWWWVLPDDDEADDDTMGWERANERPTASRPRLPLPTVPSWQP